MNTGVCGRGRGLVVGQSVQKIIPPTMQLTLVQKAPACRRSFGPTFQSNISISGRGKNCFVVKWEVNKATVPGFPLFEFQSCRHARFRRSLVRLPNPSPTLVALREQRLTLNIFEQLEYLSVLRANGPQNTRGL